MVCTKKSFVYIAFFYTCNQVSAILTLFVDYTGAITGVSCNFRELERKIIANHFRIWKGTDVLLPHTYLRNPHLSIGRFYFHNGAELADLDIA